MTEDTYASSYQRALEAGPVTDETITKMAERHRLFALSGNSAPYELPMAYAKVIARMSERDLKECILWPFSSSGNPRRATIKGYDDRPVSAAKFILAHYDDVIDEISDRRVRNSHPCKISICVNPLHWDWHEAMGREEILEKNRVRYRLFNSKEEARRRIAERYRMEKLT